MGRTQAVSGVNLNATWDLPPAVILEGPLYKHEDLWS
jgi:hypothetical protein